MRKKGKSEWDEAMAITGYRVIEQQNKKWSSRLRNTTMLKNTVDDITREQVSLFYTLYYVGSKRTTGST